MSILLSEVKLIRLYTVYLIGQVLSSIHPASKLVVNDIRISVYWKDFNLWKLYFDKINYKNLIATVEDVYNIDHP